MFIIPYPEHFLYHDPSHTHTPYSGMKFNPSLQLNVFGAWDLKQGGRSRIHHIHGKSIMAAEDWHLQRNLIRVQFPKMRKSQFSAKERLKVFMQNVRQKMIIESHQWRVDLHEAAPAYGGCWFAIEAEFCWCCFAVNDGLQSRRKKSCLWLANLVQENIYVI